MTEPGNISNLIPKGRDWIPRELADLKRQIKRGVGVPPGVVTGTGDPTGTSITSTNAGPGSSQAGPTSIAIGALATAFGVATVTIGYDGNTGGDYAVRIGFAGYAVQNAVGISTEVEAWGDSSIGIGYRAKSHGDASIAIGKTSHAEGNNAAAFGRDADAEGDQALALGSATATGANTTAIQGLASADGAVAIGSDHLGATARATAQDEFALGTDQHIVIINGKLVIADDVTGDLYHVVLTSGALSFVAYP